MIGIAKRNLFLCVGISLEVLGIAFLLYGPIHLQSWKVSRGVLSKPTFFEVDGLFQEQVNVSFYGYIALLAGFFVIVLFYLPLTVHHTREVGKVVRISALIAGLGFCTVGLCLNIYGGNQVKARYDTWHHLYVYWGDFYNLTARSQLEAAIEANLGFSIVGAALLIIGLGVIGFFFQMTRTTGSAEKRRISMEIVSEVLYSKGNVLYCTTCGQKRVSLRKDCPFCGNLYKSP